ncbi:MAG: hypothetical protein DMG21_14555 [Acidobacteria bacterium]|nr:MAG: hypothetical protein DMG21_14555 [Acidobacteriota bacterium]
MRKISRVFLGFSLLAGLLVAGACQSGANNQAQAAPSTDGQKGFWAGLAHRPGRKLMLSAGTEIRVRLDNTLSSTSNRSGDSFTATLDGPLVVNGAEVVPDGARVTGRVIAARASGHLQTPSELAVTLYSIEADGKTYELVTTDYGLAGRSHKKRNTAWIGGGAAGGALLGALLGGKKGAAIGAGAGAGGGTATAYATGKKDIVLPAESVLRFALREPLTLVKSSS